MAADLQGKRAPIVLLVEDEVMILTMLAQAMEDAGFAVIEAVNGEEARAVLQSQAAIDAMVTDVRMPGALDGLQLAALARCERPQLKVIVTSGHVHHGASAGIADDFFDKPYHIARIIQRVDQLTATQR
jgi:DNA-binding NtrC family response regulator